MGEEVVVLVFRKFWCGFGIREWVLVLVSVSVVVGVSSDLVVLLVVLAVVGYLFRKGPLT